MTKTTPVAQPVTMNNSPRMVAQRQQLEGAFGTAQFAGSKKKPMQHKADPGAVQLAAAPKKKPAKR